MRRIVFGARHYTSWSKDYGYYEIKIIPNISLDFSDLNNSRPIRLHISFLIWNLMIYFNIYKNSYGNKKV